MTVRLARVAAAGALAVAAMAVAAVLLRDDPYQLTAQFLNAGRLVEGGEVRVAGRVIGSIDDVDLSDEGLAEVRLSITETRARPLPQGTRARIRAVGAATLTNNFVELLPGPADAPSLADQAVLGPDRTTGIVDIDAIFSSLGPKAREDIRTLIGRSADVFAGSGAASFNAMLAQLSPAFAELRGVAENLSSDRAQLHRFVATASEAAQAVATRRPDLVAAVDHMARTLAAIDGEREALASVLERAPRVLQQGRRTLSGIASTVSVLRPGLRRVPAAARAAGPFLDALAVFLGRAPPTVRRLNATLPGLGRSLTALPSLAAPAERGLSSMGRVFGDARPILRGLRFYAPDFLIGVFNGLLTVGAGNYTKYGHYIHASFVQSPQDTLGGALSGQLSKKALVPGVIELQTDFRALCPGASTPPAPDGSNDYVPDPSLCDPSQGLKAEINRP